MQELHDSFAKLKGSMHARAPPPGLHDSFAQLKGDSKGSVISNDHSAHSSRTTGSTEYYHAFDGLYDPTARASAHKIEDKEAEEEFEAYYKDTFGEDKKREPTYAVLAKKKLHLPGNNWYQGKLK
jgi:hypothetical protein